MIVERFQSHHEPEWNALIRASRNGTFQFERGYMDYHRDRFEEYSFLLRSPRGELLAAFPAHAEGESIASHRGLSFGGLVVLPRVTGPTFLQAFEILLLHLQELGFSTLDCKSVPHIYHRVPSEEDRYAHFLLGSQWIRRDLLSVVRRPSRLPYQERRHRSVRRARLCELTLATESVLGEFWALLSETLEVRHGAKPVHSLGEIQLLRDAFPENIQLHTVRDAHHELLGGLVLYVSGRVAHAQYIASSTQGRATAALDLLFDHLLEQLPPSIEFLDLGSSHEDDGRGINLGLLDYKEGFGARSIVLERYRVDLRAVVPGILTRALK